MADTLKINPVTGLPDLVGTSGGGGGGDVNGPASATDNAAVRFDGTTGKLLQNSLVTITDAGELIPVSLTTSGNFLFHDYFIQRSASAKISFNDLGSASIELSEPSANAGFLSTVQVTGSEATIPALIVKSFTGQTGHVYEQRTAAGTVRLFTDVNGSLNTLGDITANNLRTQSNGVVDFNMGLANPAFRFGATSSSTDFESLVRIDSNKASNIPLIVKGAPSQTANLTEWRTDLDATRAFVEPNGTFGTQGDIYGTQFFLSDAYLSSNGTYSLQINGRTGMMYDADVRVGVNVGTSKGFIIVGATGQSADLFQNRDNGDIVLSAFDLDGNYTAQNKGSTPTTPAAGYQRLYFKTDGNLYKLNSSGVESQVNSAGGSTFSDSAFRIQDNGDATKQLAFEVAAITTGTTRTITIPDSNLNLSTGSGGSFANSTLSNLGTTAINADLLPSPGGTRHLGATTNTWANLYMAGSIRTSTSAISIDVTGRALTDSSSGTILTWGTGNLVSHKTILPSTSDTWNIGSPSARWANGYFSSSLEAPQHFIEDSGAPANNVGVLIEGPSDLDAELNLMHTTNHSTPQSYGLGVGTNAQSGSDDSRGVHVGSGPVVDGTSGDVEIFSGYATTGTGSTGIINFLSGEVTSGTSGSATFATGTANGSGGTTGQMFIHTGNAVDSGTGAITIATGATTDAPTGNIQMFTGTGTGTSDTGSIEVNTGNTPDGSSGGIQIETGSSGTSLTGSIQVTTGEAQGGSQSGQIDIISGDNTGSGDSGPITIETGDSSSQTSGNLNLRTGSGNATSGNITIETGSAATQGTISLNSGGNPFRSIQTGLISVTVPALVAGSIGDSSATITGLVDGDFVFVTPANAGFEDGLTITCYVSAADTLTINMVNNSLVTLTGSTTDWRYVVVKG